MPFLTRSQRQILREKEIETLNAMVEENPFHRFHQANPNEITEEDIQIAQQDPNFHKFMEKVLEKYGERFLLMLVEPGENLPKDFDVNRLKEAPKRDENKPQNIDQVAALTHQMQNFQQ